MLREGRVRGPQETISAGLLLGSQVEEGGCYVGDVRYDVLFDGQVACKKVLACALLASCSIFIRDLDYISDLESSQVTCYCRDVFGDTYSSGSTLSLQGVTKC